MYEPSRPCGLPLNRTHFVDVVEMEEPLVIKAGGSSVPPTGTTLFYYILGDFRISGLQDIDTLPPPLRV